MWCVYENSGAVQSHDAGLQLICNVCPMCDQQFDNADRLQLHVNTHFDEEQASSE